MKKGVILFGQLIESNDICESPPESNNFVIPNHSSPSSFEGTFERFFQRKAVGVELKFPPQLHASFVSVSFVLKLHDSCLPLAFPHGRRLAGKTQEKNPHLQPFLRPPPSRIFRSAASKIAQNKRSPKKSQAALRNLLSSWRPAFCRCSSTATNLGFRH